MSRFLPVAAALVSPILSLVAGGALLPACQVYDPQLVTRDTGPTVCETLRPPARPTTADGTTGPEVTFGLRRVFLDQGGLWESTGFDIDGYCTSAPAFDGECNSGGPGQRDGNTGIDNVFGQSLYPLVESAVPGLEAMAVAAQEEGRGMPLLRIRDWNGTANDPQVEIAIAQAVFGTSAEAPGGGPPAVTILSETEWTLMDGSPVPLPAWDGNDYLWPRTDAFLAGDIEQPLIVDDTAYIVDNTFVARLPDRIDIIFPTDDIGVLVRLTGAIATGRLSDDGLSLDPVTVAGRWRISDLLSTAENIGICRGTAEYNLLANQLERISDVRSMPPAPGDPITDCDAVSIGVTFLGSRVTLVTPTPGLPLVDLCSLAPDGGLPDGGAGSDAGMPDAGMPDTGMPDTGMPDAP
jgi:hypothetical protein